MTEGVSGRLLGSVSMRMEQEGMFLLKENSWEKMFSVDTGLRTHAITLRKTYSTL